MLTFHLSLRALKHPLTLLSIGLLLLNDHILKVVAPSWLTGKLSDFAGLFFFPFLLAALLAFPLEILRLSPRRIMVTSCLITVTWFTLIKAAPFANEATELLATRLLGLPAQIVLDPTDLFALPMIALAWWLWVKLERTAPAPKLGWEAYVVLGTAALATMATAPCSVPISVHRVEVIDEELYIQAQTAISQQAFGPSQIFKINATRYDIQHQFDGGVPAKILDVFQQSSEQNPVCAPDDPRHCFQIVGQQINESQDGGQSWQLAWETPWGRREFMSRQARFRIGLGCGTRAVDLGPYDVAILPVSGSYRLLVAMGTDGLLIRTSDGEWLREGISGTNYYATPMPYSTQSIAELVFTLAPENVVLVVAALATLFLFPVLGRRRLLNSARGASRVMRTAFLIAGAVLVAWVPFVFWAYGIIPWYLLALALSLMIIASAYYFGWRSITRNIESD